MNPIKYYFDLMSQPSRTLYILFKLNNIPFEPISVALRKGEHLTDEYKKNVNRFQKVPCINDNGFKLSESIAILRYLDGKNLISKQWYPNDLQLRGRIDEYLEWQHHNVRAHCALYFIKKWLEPTLFGKEVNPNLIAKLKENMENSLDIVENIWLKNQKFIATDSITVADIFAASEMEQPKAANYDPFENRPKLKEWYERVKNATNPHYNEAHKVIYKLIEKNQLKAKL